MNFIELLPLPEPPKPLAAASIVASAGVIFVFEDGIQWEMLPQEMGDPLETATRLAGSRRSNHCIELFGPQVSGETQTRSIVRPAGFSECAPQK